MACIPIVFILKEEPKKVAEVLNKKVKSYIAKYVKPDDIDNVRVVECGGSIVLRMKTPESYLLNRYEDVATFSSLTNFNDEYMFELEPKYDRVLGISALGEKFELHESVSLFKWLIEIFIDGFRDFASE